MRILRFLSFFLSIGGFLLVAGWGYAAPQGALETYAPLIFRGLDPLPDEPLLLISQDTPTSNLFWVNGTNTFQRQLTNGDYNDFAHLSPDGDTILFFQNRANDPNRHLLLDAQGGTPLEIPITLENRQWSSDSRYISYFDYAPEDYRLHTYEVSTGITRTLDMTATYNTQWHPDTHQLYFTGTRNGEDGLYRINGDGSGGALVFEDADEESIRQILPDGRIVIDIRNYDEFRYDLMIMNPDGTNATPLRSLPEMTRFVSISPWGNGLFYENAGTGTLYVETLEGQGIMQFQPPCPAPYDRCFAVGVDWRPGSDELVFRWQQQVVSTATFHSLLYIVTLDGSAPQLLEDRALINSAKYSPGGQYLAVEIPNEIVIWDRNSQTVSATIAAPNSGRTMIQGWRPMPSLNP